jgi:hypothetical protein
MGRIRIGLEVPIAHLHELEGEVDYHFVIATTAAKYPEYLEFYKDIEFEMIMLDNGAFEAHAGGEDPVPLNVEQLYEIADEIKPSLVWAPDHPFNQLETQVLSLRFLQLSRERGASWKVGFIPQGRTVDEILESWYMLGPKFDWIGLSFLNDREAMLRLARPQMLFGEPIHMLGYSYTDELLTMPRIPLTLDTSKPIKAAKLNKRLSELRKGEGLLLPTDIVSNKELMIANIEALRNICNGNESV